MTFREFKEAGHAALQREIEHDNFLYSVPLPRGYYVCPNCGCEAESRNDPCWCDEAPPFSFGGL